MIEIYTDGSVRNNGYKNSVGGYGFVVVCDDNILYAEAVNNTLNTTNNEQELTAINQAAEFAGDLFLYDNEITIYTDSEYSLNCVTKWYKGWRKNGWVKNDGSPIKNLNLIQNIVDCIETYNDSDDLRLYIEKVPAHSGVEYNELADKLATGQIKVEDIKCFEY